ncbi:MAG: hypothetical protein QMC93_00315 [Patescibacteria group bacterium]|nr:hypothetical protein [Patescibacteria group bacterium]
MRKEKAFLKIWLLIIIIFIVMIGISDWQYHQSQKEITKILKPKEIVETPKEKKLQESTAKNYYDETANWKTYRNEDYGFEIRYPFGYNISKYAKTDVGPAIEAIGTTSYSSIIFRDFTGYFTREEIENKKQNSEKIKIGSLEAYRGSLIGNMDGGIDLSVSFYDYPEEGRVLNILFSTHQPPKEEEINTFNQILSTFRFLE